MSKIPKTRTKEEKRALKFGVIFTGVIHITLFFLLALTGLRKIDPPPVEKGIVIDYTELPPIPRPVEVEHGNEPRSTNPKPNQEIRLVQKSKSATIGSKPNKGMETTMSKQGDVAKIEPNRPKPINRKALFPSNQNGDSLSPEVASKISTDLSAGHPEGNTQVGRTDGEPSAKLAGRSLMGSLPAPDYTINKSGKVVVKIIVDQYGKVLNAIPGVSGTTVQDKTLWIAAKDAALKAKFNISSTAPGVQEGTITYIFRLR